MNTMQVLFNSLNQRKRPEDIADLIAQELKGLLSRSEADLLQRAAKGSLRQHLFGYTSMLQEFAKPVGAARQVATAIDLFERAYPLSIEACDEPEVVEQFIRHLGQEIGKSFGKSNFIGDRLDRKAREAAGMEMSRRRYNKLFRHLTKMEGKLEKLLRELQKLKFTKIGKSGLAHSLSWQDFSSDTDSACFIAYYTARSNLRSQFTIHGQARGYDEIAEMLFERCRSNPNSNWWAIAHLLPKEEVLDKLSDEQKGELLGKWMTILEEMAYFLQEIWERSDIKRKTMVVRRGNDSTTWNNTASAWNKARDNWIALLYAMGMEGLLEMLCFGKVLRLMAGDVVAWHYMAGGQLDANTFVWNELPLPWEVFSGRQTCTLSMVEQACRKQGIDPTKSGWTAPRPPTKVAKFNPTAELVHGISVNNPFLADYLRDLGFYSGKKVKAELSQPLASQVHGQVLRAHLQGLTTQSD
jgi:hypothetical protein